MTDYLSRLAARALGTELFVKPLTAPLFAPRPDKLAATGDDIALVKDEHLTIGETELTPLTDSSPTTESADVRSISRQPSPHLYQSDQDDNRLRSTDDPSRDAEATMSRPPRLESLATPSQSSTTSHATPPPVTEFAAPSEEDVFQLHHHSVEDIPDPVVPAREGPAHEIVEIVPAAFRPQAGEMEPPGSTRRPQRLSIVKTDPVPDGWPDREPDEAPPGTPRPARRFIVREEESRTPSGHVGSQGLFDDWQMTPHEPTAPEPASSAQTIRVSIGRVDVRSVQHSQATATPSEPSPPISLDDYLRGDYGGGR
jgi:hypothetical protein